MRRASGSMRVAITAAVVAVVCITVAGDPAHGAASVSVPGARVSGPVTAATIAAAKATSYSIDGGLTAVAAISRENAWAVGSTYNSNANTSASKVLVLHWNGNRWSRVPLNLPGSLRAVSAASPSDVWMVGSTGIPTDLNDRLLVLHWNGKTLSRVKVPGLAGSGELADEEAVAVAASAHEVWVAVNPVLYATPWFLHLTGGHWYLVPAPVPKTGIKHSAFAAIAMVSPRLVWAAGYNQLGMFLDQWNGSAWKLVPVKKSIADYDSVAAMAAGPGGTVWGAGEYDVPGTDKPIAVRWNGKSWSEVTVDAAGMQGIQSFLGVSATPGSSRAWAVGYSIIAEWTGSAWKEAAEAGPGAYWWLWGVSAASPSDAWAVGLYYPHPTSNGPEQTLILHWNGKNWS